MWKIRTVNLKNNAGKNKSTDFCSLYLWLSNCSNLAGWRNNTFIKLANELPAYPNDSVPVVIQEDETEKGKMLYTPIKK